MRRTDDARAGAACHHDQLDRPRRARLGAGAQRTYTSTTTPTSAGSAASAKCTVSASYNDRYHDYDVDVHSNQPSQTVTVTDAGGRTATWHTDASGYADVYLNAGSDASGDTITARVGNASCQGTL